MCRLLLCDREESRPMEAVFRCCYKPIAAAFPTLWSVPTNTVARAMVNCALAPSGEKISLLDNKAIHDAGKPVPGQDSVPVASDDSKNKST